MSNPSRSLACLLDWRDVIETLDLDCPRRVDLPLSMVCPLCKTGALTIMRDFVLNSQWLNCQACQFSGDLIELAARVMERSIPDVIMYLEARALFNRPLSESDVKGYIEGHVEYRRRIKEFWESARRAPCRFNGVGRSGYSLMRDFSLECISTQAYWPEREGRLFGIAPCETVEQLFFPQSYAVQERTNRNGKTSIRLGGGPGQRRLFHGRDWTEVLVIAHSDLPGRIIGFSFIGGNPAEPEVVFKRANVGNCVSTPRESGLGFLNALAEPTYPAMKGVAFLLMDPKVSTFLHTRHLRESQHPLPVLLMKQSRDFRCLNFPPEVQDRELIFCGPPLETLPLAKAVNGKVSLYELTTAEIRTNLKHQSSLHWLHQFQKKAVPWLTAFRRLMTTLAPADLEILLGRLSLTANESRNLIEGLGGQAGQCLAQAGPHRIGGKSIDVRGHIIVESESGWVARKGGREISICNLPIRIERIYQTNSGDKFYEVAVHVSQDPVMLIVSERDLKSRTLFDLVSLELRDSHNRQLQYTQTKWAKESFSIAMRFSDPQHIVYSNRVGWDPVQRKFQFPKFSILNNGKIDPMPMPIRQFDLRQPAAEMAAPMPCRESVTLLSRVSPETQIIWALAACVAHNLLAGNCLRKPLGVILDGQYALETGVIAATALGCGCVNTFDCGRTKISDYVSKKCGEHDFPSLVRFGEYSKYQISPTWLDDQNLRNAILPLPARTAIAVSSHGGFVRICADGHPQPLGQLTSAAPWIIPTYLMDLCRRKKQFYVSEHNDDLFTVLGDLAEWFHQLGGNANAVLAARELLILDSCSLALAFVELVERMQVAKEIRFAGSENPSPGRVRIPTAVIEHQAQAGQTPVVQVKIGVINEVLSKKSAPAIHPGDVLADLIAQSAWCGTLPTPTGEDWSIDAEWWSQGMKWVRRNRHSTTT